MKHTFLHFSLFRSYSFQSFFSCVLLSLSSTFYLSPLSFFAYPLLSLSVFLVCLLLSFFLAAFYLTPRVFFVYHLIFLSASVLDVRFFGDSSGSSLVSLEVFPQHKSWWSCRQLLAIRHSIFLFLPAPLFLSVCSTNPFQQLLAKGKDLPVRVFRKWKIILNRKIKDLYQKSIKNKVVSLWSN